MEEFRAKCDGLLKQIDSLPMTGKENDEKSRNALKETVVALRKIDEQMEQLLSRYGTEEELKKLEMQLGREWLSFLTTWNKYGHGLGARGDFAGGFRNVSLEANNLVEELRKTLKDAKKGGHRSSLVR